MATVDFVHELPVDFSDWRLVGEFRCCNRTDLRDDMPDLVLLEVRLKANGREWSLPVAVLHQDMRAEWEDEAAREYDDERNAIVACWEEDLSEHERDKLHHAHRRYVTQCEHAALESRLARIREMER